MRLDKLETPALILDMDAFDRNMSVMKDYMESAGLALRPHYKSHKSTAIAHMQIVSGAKGITCAKLSEAEDLIFSGIDDVLIANQIVGSYKLARVAYLAGCCHLTVCVDNVDNICDLEAAAAAQGTIIYCLVEYEIGMNRCGVDTPEAFFALAGEIDRSPNLVFGGIQAYAGNLSHEEDCEIRRSASEKVEARLSELRCFVEQKGLHIKEISGASTGTVEFHTKNSAYTEIQAGSYIFMDAAYNALHLKFQNALFVTATVMSANGSNVILDAGRKSISIDQKMPALRDYPQVPIKVSEEHSAISTENLQASIGEKFLLIPGHCCTTVNLHDHIYLVRQGRVIDRISVDSRGKSV